MAYHTSALVFALFSIFFVSALAAPMTYNVVSLGAKADGKSDSTQAFLSAWKFACASVKPATIYVPAGSFYLRQVAFSGPCKNNAIIIRIDGTLVAHRTLGSLGTPETGFCLSMLMGLRYLVEFLMAKALVYGLVRPQARAVPLEPRYVKRLNRFLIIFLVNL